MLKQIPPMTQQEKQKLGLVSGYVHSQESFGTVDGPGIRYVFFLQGCPLRCLYCHNPDSIPQKQGNIWTAAQVVRQVLRHKSYIQSGGVTLSGGEPLYQPEFATAILKLLAQEGIHTAIDTSGFMPLSLVQQAVDTTDLILLDIKALEPELCRDISGADNANALALLNYCEQTGKPVWIRHVLLKGYTLDEKKLEDLAKFLQGYTCVQRIELLPFHKLGESKWQELDPALGLEYQLYDTPETSKEEAQWARALFRKYGFTVQ